MSALSSLLVYLHGITDLLFFLLQMGPAAFFKYSNSRAFGRGDGSKECCRQWWVKQVGRIQMSGQFISGVALMLLVDCVYCLNQSFFKSQRTQPRKPEEFFN